VEVTPDIPDKSQFRVNEVCQLTDTQPYVLRFWESEFPQLAPDRGRGGSRVYKKDDVELILRIKHLLYEKEYTIAGARRLLDGADPLEAVVGEDYLTESRPAPELAAAEPEAPILESPQDDESSYVEPRQLDLTDLQPDRPTLVSAPDHDDDQASRETEISRVRYEDAIDEISHLRLRLGDAETRLRKAVVDGEGWRERSEQAASRIERILEKIRTNNPA
jgi:DNA-binding transcriptional MerR regulator